MEIRAWLAYHFSPMQSQLTCSVGEAAWLVGLNWYSLSWGQFGKIYHDHKCINCCASNWFRVGHMHAAHSTTVGQLWLPLRGAKRKWNSPNRCNQCWYLVYFLAVLFSEIILLFAVLTIVYWASAICYPFFSPEPSAECISPSSGNGQSQSPGFRIRVGEWRSGGFVGRAGVYLGPLGRTWLFPILAFLVTLR